MTSITLASTVVKLIVALSVVRSDTVMLSAIDACVVGEPGLPAAEEIIETAISIRMTPAMPRTYPATESVLRPVAAAGLIPSFFRAFTDCRTLYASWRQVNPAIIINPHARWGKNQQRAGRYYSNLNPVSLTTLMQASTTSASYSLPLLAEISSSAFSVPREGR